jgi:hypothetical protein
MVSGTKLQDVRVSKKSLRGNAETVQAAHDPMLDLTRMIDGPAREARKPYEAQEEIKRKPTRKSRKRVRHRRHEQLSGRDFHAASVVRKSHGAMKKMGNKFRLLRISPDFISARPNTPTAAL